MVNGFGASKKIMRIGQLTQRAGVSRDTVRFYERRGLLVDVTRPEASNNYKDYGETSLKRIEIIRYLQRFDFTLAECRELLDAREERDDKCVDRGALFSQKLRQIDEKIESLRQTREAVEQVMAELGGGKAA